MTALVASASGSVGLVLLIALLIGWAVLVVDALQDLCGRSDYDGATKLLWGAFVLAFPVFSQAEFDSVKARVTG